MATPKIAKFEDFWIVTDTAADEDGNKDIASGPCTLFHIRVGKAWSSSPTPSVDNFLKMYDDINPTIGTTAPNEQIPILGHLTISPEDNYPINPPDGLKFNKGLSYAVTLLGGTADSAAPSDGTVDVQFILRKDD